MAIIANYWWIGWIVGAIASFRPAFRGLLPKYKHSALDWNDIGFTAFMTVFVAGFFWPGVFAFFGLQKLAEGSDPKSFARLIGGESKNDKIKRLEIEKEQRKLQIDRMERELEIGPYAQ